MYLIRVKEERRHAIAYETPDSYWADVENGLYVTQENATRFRRYEDAKRQVAIMDEEVVEVNDGK